MTVKTAALDEEVVIKMHEEVCCKTPSGDLHIRLFSFHGGVATFNACVLRTHPGSTTKGVIGVRLAYKDVSLANLFTSEIPSLRFISSKGDDHTFMVCSPPKE